jgi:hypothetical protein
LHVGLKKVEFDGCRRDRFIFGNAAGLPSRYDLLNSGAGPRTPAAIPRASIAAGITFKRGNMATVRVSPTEVQVDNIIYIFESSGVADDFEACVATVDVGHCETQYLAIGKRDASVPPVNEFPVD